MERETGFEPATSSLGSLQSSATERELPFLEAVNCNKFNHLCDFELDHCLSVAGGQFCPTKRCALE